MRAARLVDDLVHRHVERRHRDLVDHLAGEAYPHLVHVSQGRKGEEAVVVAAPATKAVPLAVESHAGDYDKVYARRFADKFARRFTYAECPCRQIVLAAVGTYLHRAASHHGKEYLFLPAPPLYELMRAYFVGEGVEKQDAPCPLELLRSFKALKYQARLRDFLVLGQGSY